MKKLFISSLIVVFGMIATVFLLPDIKQANMLPNQMIVTYNDIVDANSSNMYGKCVNLELDKDLNVTNSDGPIETILRVNLFNIFTIKKINVKLITDTKVFIGGETVGFNLFSDGVICVGNNSVYTENGFVEPLKNSELQDGDAILKIEDYSIDDINDLDRIINLPSLAGKELTLTVRRNGKDHQIKATPVYDLISNRYKLGLWIRNNASGVGTLTYVKVSNYRFGAVGHPIIDETLGENFQIDTGNLYKCKLLGIKKGEKNNPGEIKSTINLSDNSLGLADTNCKYGVYGNIYNKSIVDATKTASLGGRLSVKLGDAKIYCNIDDSGVKAYDIKILKANKQSNADDKSLTIKITDPELLAKTGGIIQGMSGSPIVQNGKLIGAVTHVFVNDPTLGYGVYIDWMIDN